MPKFSGSGDIWFICVTMRYSDSSGPPPTCLPVATSTKNCRKNPSVMNDKVNIIATGPFTSVLHVTPMAITSTICTQMLMWALTKFHSGEPSGRRM